MTIFSAPLRRTLAVVSFLSASGLVACGSAGSDDPNGSASNSQASTSPVACPAGAIHPRTCIEPLSFPADSGVDTTGDYALDVNNDVNAPCPDGYTLDDSKNVGICCSAPSDTEVSECGEPYPKCTTDSNGEGECGSAEVWSFAATSCSDATWAAAHPSVCDESAVSAAVTCADDLDYDSLSDHPECVNAGAVVRITWADAGLTGP